MCESQKLSQRSINNECNKEILNLKKIIKDPIYASL